MGALFLSAAALAAQAGQLTAYSSASADTLKLYADQFAKSHPNIKVNWVRDSTGIMQAKLMAEKDNPRADVVFGHTAANLVALNQAGMLTPHDAHRRATMTTHDQNKGEPAATDGV